MSYLDPATPKTKTVTLATPADWVDWIWVFEDKCRSAGITKYVDPSTDDVFAEPERPSRQAIADAFGDASGAHDVSQYDLRVTTLFTSLFEEYRIDNARYTEDKKMIKEVDDWISATVDRSWLQLYDGPRDPRSIVVWLHARLAPSPAQIQADARARYRELLGDAKHGSSVQRSLMGWYLEWEATRRKCERLKVPDVEGPLAIEDFFTAADDLRQERWAAQMRTEFRIAQLGLGGGKSYTLAEYGVMLYHELSQNRDRAGLAFATSDPSITDSSKPDRKCPCPRRPHPWPPQACYVVKEVLGMSDAGSGYTFTPAVLDHTRKELEKAEWRTLPEKVRATSSNQKRIEYPGSISA